MKKILIVDDDPNIRLLFAEILKMDGFEIATASTGTKALQSVLEDHFNLLILDIKMPGIHGLEILRRLREKGRNLPIIICSAFEGMQDDFSIKSYGISDYLVKPVDLKLLSASVKKALAKDVI
ncbi:MAG: response regulator [Candidatus Cloacimonadota bacterium]|nr:MAG: response regulator [Candidatus Cloacimonadota bacterium]